MFSLCTYLPAIYVSLGQFDNYSIYLFVLQLITTHDFILNYIMSVNYATKLCIVLVRVLDCTLYEQSKQRNASTVVTNVYSNV